MRMKSSGGSIRDERITAMQDVVDRLFADDPSYRNDIVIWDTGEIIPARVYEHKHRDSGTPRKKIQTPYNVPFTVGTIFRIGDEGYWVCIEAFNAHQMNYQGTLEHCNYTLRFMLNNQIKEYPVSMKNATQYNSGETNKPQMILGSSQHLIYIPYDKSTIQLNNGARFLIDRNKEDPTAYKLTQVDSTSYAYEETGLIQWTVTEDQFSPALDNKELMIANYYDKNPVFKIQVINASSPISLSIGSEFQLQVKVLKDGQPAEQTVISYESSDQSVATVSKDGKIAGVDLGECFINITCSDAVGKLLVNVENSISTETYTISVISQDGDLSIMYGDTEQFEVRVYKDDITQEGADFEAEIMAEENLAEITSIISSAISIHTIDNEKNIGKGFVLHVWNTELGADTNVPLKVGGLWDD